MPTRVRYSLRVDGKVLSLLSVRWTHDGLGWAVDRDTFVNHGPIAIDGGPVAFLPGHLVESLNSHQGWAPNEHPLGG